MSEIHYIISETVLRDFLDYHAQGMALGDVQAEVLLARPIHLVGLQSDGSMWWEDA